MLKKLLVFVYPTVLASLLLINQSSCLASNEWTEKDSKFEKYFIVLTALDIYQTSVTIHNDGFENNPIVQKLVGEYPSDKQLLELFIGWSVAHYVISKHLPIKLRRIFQVVTFSWTLSDTATSYGTKIIVNRW